MQDVDLCCSKLHCIALMIFNYEILFLSFPLKKYLLYNFQTVQQKIQLSMHIADTISFFLLFDFLSTIYILIHNLEIFLHLLFFNVGNKFFMSCEQKRNNVHTHFLKTICNFNSIQNYNHAFWTILCNILCCCSVSQNNYPPKYFLVVNRLSNVSAF